MEFDRYHTLETKAELLEFAKNQSSPSYSDMALLIEYLGVHNSRKIYV
jgi:hypothetical protein